ncbi:MAG: heme ABC transporter permease [Xanthomonadales bacterium]|nr:heme ABC transporter permease [Gammaproteobacteria bacterium]MBT8053726.1 heme ABC transporter permease [Gammaproteobacteria bacterium]NND56739.1 heme ABC transporter permease [Xanthomonadales bacterium]NNK50965.1 heme ABC transporter permease [Xanthomonadales bacterium]
MNSNTATKAKPRKHPVVLFIHKLGSPPWFYDFAGKFIPWLWLIFGVLTVLGLYLGLVKAPEDYLQGQSVRIIYLHVPAAWMSMMIYSSMAVMGFIALVWRIRIVEILAMASAPIGAAFTIVTLTAGSLWGRPTWGTYWVWDARLTSELVLLFLYLGVIGLYNSIDEPRKAARAACLLAIVGAVNLPIIHYSVKWWNTLHQGSSISLMGGSSIDSSMLYPLLIMAVATKFYYGANLLTRARIKLLEQDKRKAWVREILKEKN